VRENRVNSGRKDLHCPKSLTPVVTENGSGSDAVVLDKRMNGDRVANQMKLIKPDIPILMVSAYGGLSDKELRCVDAFLCKGGSWSTLVSTLDQLLNLRFPVFIRWLEDWKHQQSQ
jgi:hypothetical protein